MKLSEIYRIVDTLNVPEREKRALIRAAFRRRGDVLMALEAAQRRYEKKETRA